MLISIEHEYGTYDNKKIISECCSEDILMIMCKAIYSCYNGDFNANRKRLSTCFYIIRHMLYAKSK